MKLICRKPSMGFGSFRELVKIAFYLLESFCVRYLHRLCISRNIGHVYGFIDPHTIQEVGDSVNEVQTAMEASCRLNSRKGRVKWIIPMSQMQVGSYEYGYYVMLHILNIVSAVILEMWDERFANPEPFSSEEID
ncbi:unnamed protein product [Cuscuta europaea]|uniref:Uncharacterized protein n=1 Tax=Cuscuta europaea TaxID=41803 RepID=A0A9P0ZG40_CUSEU|nr:unnamed protein product [Cuscuta europaea]